MAKSEGPSISNFMHQNVSFCHTNSIVSYMACIFDVKNNVYITGNSSKIVLCLWAVALIV